MSNSLLAFFGIAGGIVNTIGLAPYIRDILLKKTKPERATWWIWLALDLIAVAALIDAGPTWSLALLGAQTIAIALIAGLSIKYGYGKFRRKDFISLIIAGFGIVLWRLTHQPLLALLIVIAVDFIGLWLTVTKTWKAPHTETLISWVLAAVATLLGVLAVGELNLTKYIFQAYILFGNSLIIGVIIYRRSKVRLTEEKNAR